MRLSVVQEAIEARLEAWFPDPVEVEEALKEIMTDIRAATAARRTPEEKEAHRMYMRRYMTKVRAEKKAKASS